MDNNQSSTPPTPPTQPTPPVPGASAAPAKPAAPPAAATAVGPVTISYDDFAKLDLRVATVLECRPHGNADKLLVLQIEVGSERRQICAGLRQHYQPEQLVGKQIIIVANLAPRQMRGEISNGMLLAATDPTSGRVIVIGPSEPVASGSKVN
jgi:methionyl-tRNA synthetase